MKNLPYVLNAILFVAVIVLYVLFFKSGSKNDLTPSVKFENDSSFTLPVAYVNIDSVLVNYTYAKDINETLMRKFESSRASVNQKQKNFVSEQQEFQRKLQNNGFLNEERAKVEYERIQKVGLELEKTAGRLEQELAVEQHKMNTQLEDSIRNCIKEYNLQANYQVIFSNTGGLSNIIYAKEGYDITDAVLALLNSRYTSPAKKD
ncbi:OmpH family outer membrane protein [Dysgonomonas sp. 520]|uniref:OmpH family outer membrane protein n=1 Tax=Dysgonomonas sp. 520 TaxID=2302931 RepID=UPI0013D65A87|nr:OmpH family outer membrane protein [Dysgonomonas sp. 520]NDW09144.1 OmpH family outer membrane protein [Dysgonomonas sp. 520]